MDRITEERIGKYKAIVGKLVKKEALGKEDKAFWKKENAKEE